MGSVFEHSCSLPLHKCVFWPITCVVLNSLAPGRLLHSSPILQETSFCLVPVTPSFHYLPFAHKEVKAENDKCDSRDFGGSLWPDWKSPYTYDITPLWKLGSSNHDSLNCRYASHRPFLIQFYSLGEAMLYTTSARTCVCLTCSIAWATLYAH